MIRDYSTTSSSLSAPIEGWTRFRIPDEATVFRTSVDFQTTKGFEPLIVSDPEIQGGILCLRNTRVTVPSIIESIANGHSLQEMATTLKEYFHVSISPKEIEWAVADYKVALALIAEGGR